LTASHGILWANPPFESTKKVLTKAVLNPCKIILVTPVWVNMNWKALLEKLTIMEEVVPRFTPVFEKCTGGVLLPGRHWATSVVYIDTATKTVPKTELDPILVRELESETQGLGPVELLERIAYIGSGKLSGGEEEGESDSSSCCSEKMVVVDKVKTNGREAQLTLKVRVEFPSGFRKILTILIDTGAQANLLREGIIPHSEFSRAEERLHFSTANGQCLRGGDREVDTRLLLRKKSERGVFFDYPVEAKFYEADIHVDAILGCPWLAQKNWLCTLREGFWPL